MGPQLLLLLLGIGCAAGESDPSGAEGSGGASAMMAGNGGTGTTSGSMGGASGIGGAGGAGGRGAGGDATASGGMGGVKSGAGGASGSSGGNATGTGGAMACAGPPGGGGASAGAVGQWSNVTPGSISLVGSAYGGDNFGVQDVLVDPARPSDLYVFVCHQGVYKSTDYGLTYAKVNTGTNGTMIDSGKPWGEGIHSNRCRDPNTPPTLYSAGSQGGFWKSIDGGVNWTKHNLPDDGKPRPQDAYDVDVDPNDGKHLIVGFHEEPGLVESTDGGETWRSVTFASGMNSGTSWYPFFIDTGVAATTRTTWLMISQTTATTGTWRTTDSGASWTKVEGNEHPHGQSQIFQYKGVVYMAGVYGTNGWGVYRSTDFGATWTHLGSGAAQGVIYGTPKYIYAQASGAVGNGTIDQSQSERAAQPGTTWATWSEPAMSNGPKRAAVTYDGTHYIIVGGNWNAGIWRYVEP